ncbi:MAG: YfiR family protein [Flavobacteriales bacterium]
MGAPVPAILRGYLPRVVVLAAAFTLMAMRQQPESRTPDKDTTAIVQASYIYNIAKLVDWKDPAQKNGNFIIGVLGSANVYQELIKKYATKSIGKQPIEVRKLPRSADVERCHILFVGQSELNLMQAINKSLEKRSTLLITEYPDALEDGAVVNFVRIANTVKYDLSVSNARKHHLEVGSTLRQLANRVIE